MKWEPVRRWLGLERNGSSLREKWVSLLGGVVALAVLLRVSCGVLHLGAAAVLGSAGASVVLLFAVPHGALSQPWPLLAGQVGSAVVGVACARWIPSPEIAAACAVGLSIGLMHQFRCLHPPGGATALGAVWGGPAVRALGFHYVWCPVLLNCVILLVVAVAFNSLFGWRRYPAAWSHPGEAAPPADAPTHEQVVRVLREIDTFVDVGEEDLIRLSHLLVERTQPGRGSRPD